MIRAWYRRRKRAVALGDMRHALLWFDPETGRLWQARRRWSLFTVPSSLDGLDEAVRMLEVVHCCELWVDPDDPRLLPSAEG